MTRLALALAFLTAALGIAFGTFTADGADSYGYVSQADLWLHRTLIIDEPLAGEAPWRNANWTLTAFGYRPGDRRGTIVPTYSAGPDNAVILSNQHSGSLRYYAGRITMRFEWLDPDMYVPALAYFERLSRPVYVVLDHWEREIFRSRYGSVADLSWLDRPPLLLAFLPQVTERSLDTRRVASVKAGHRPGARNTLGYNEKTL